MEIRVEKGQLRWKVLNFVFWGFVTLIFPVALSLFHLSTSGFPMFMIVGPIASIFVNICIFLQKNWPIDRRVQAALYTTICLVFVHVLAFVPYYLFLLSNHRRYDNAEYTPVYVDRRLIWSTYVGLFSAIAISFVITLASAISRANSPNLEEFHVFIVFVLPLSIISAFVALIAQILVWRQESWSLRNKIINIVLIEVVFVSIGSMVGLTMYLVEYISPIFRLLLCGIFFIPFTGCVLLRHIFIKSSLDALERKE